MLLYTFLGWLDIKSCLLFLSVCLLLADILLNRNPKNFPPGPWPLPLLGNVFTGVDYKAIDKLAAEYGSVFSLRWGREKMVFVSGYKRVKEALVDQGEIFADRPITPLFHKVFKGLGLGLSSGYLWKKQRRFAVTHLKHFGEGKKTLESFIQQECGFVCEAIREEHGHPFNPHFTLNNAVANIICSLVFGHRFDYNDENFQRILRLTARTFNLIASTRAQLYNAFPGVLKYLPGPHQTIFSNYAKVTGFIREEIEKHKADWDPSDPRDFIDAYFGEIGNRKDDTEAGFNMENLVICCLDFFEAGTETTSTTLRWGLLYMIKYPEIQKKVQGEIDSVIGQGRQPSMDDRASMPYTDAVIHEIMRIGNIVPLNVAHMTNKDTTLGGYFLPKGTTVITNFTSVLCDKKEWETAETFNPRHFLDSNGKFFKRESFIPFSAGRRVCLGEQLARMELFLFFTSLLQRFSFSPPPGEEPKLEIQEGFTLCPQPFQICASPR
ncbi:cytochrome P450 2J2 [Amia ocellicauda]|uniref:cytochrome P450 2J2 n=1 Tax=Amia ocellicauda TaxID=2972642 RepID=UPI0034645BDD